MVSHAAPRHHPESRIAKPRIIVRALACLALLALLALQAGSGCGRPAEPVNVVWITLDALRADHLGCYGYPRPTSPFLDSLAGQGVRFDAAFSQAPATKASVASMFTSLHPSIHQAVAHGSTGREGDVLPARATTLAERFAETGMLTAGFVANPHLQEVFGFHQGFDVYRYLSRGPVAKADTVIGDVLGWLGAEPQVHTRPFFLYIHLMDTHFPYEPPQPHRGMFVPPALENGHAVYTNGIPDTPPSPRDMEFIQGLYDGALHFADQHIETLVREMGRMGLLENTLLVVTADHGDEFLDHGGLGHGSSLYNELIRVPLIMVHPTRLPAGRVIRTPVALVDLGPTILAWCGINWDPALVTGIDRSALLSGGDLTDRAEAAPPLISERSRFQVALIADGHKYVFRRKPGNGEKLFDLHSDSLEANNLMWSDKALRDRMTAEAAASWAEINALNEKLGLEQSSAPMTDGTRDQLRQLGYIE